MLVRFRCPTCAAGLKAPANRAGAKVSCPKCKKQVLIPAADDEPLLELGPADEVPVAPPPAPMDFAAEPDTEPLVRTSKTPHRGTLILILGVISLVVGLFGFIPGIIAWVMGSRDLSLMRTNRMDRSGQGMTQAGYYCGIAGTVLHSIGLCLVLMFYVFWFQQMAYFMDRAGARAQPRVNWGTPDVPVVPTKRPDLVREVPIQEPPVQDKVIEDMDEPVRPAPRLPDRPRPAPVVRPDRQRPAEVAPPGAREKAEVLWGSTWYPSEVLAKKDDRFYIHYTDWDDRWDEWVTKERIRFPDKKP